MAQSRFTGELTPGTGIVVNEHISQSTKIDADKIQHLHKAGTNFDLAIGDTPVTREEIIYVCGAANATIRHFRCLLNENGTSTDIDFDLKVNGVSILSAVVNLDEADSDGTVLVGSISSASLNLDDIVSISMAVTSATGAEGPFAWVEIEENAA